MSKFNRVVRCLPGNLVMAEAVPFGQKWTYHSNHPMSEMIKPEYFMNLSHQFRAGDELRLIKMAENKVASFADVLVVANPLEFHLINGPTILNRNDGFELAQVDGDWAITEYGEVLSTYRTKKDAEAALKWFTETDKVASNG